MVSIPLRHIICEQCYSRREAVSLGTKFEIIICVEEYKILKEELAAKFEILPR